MSSPFATLTPEQRDYLLHALDVTREHDQQHLDWLLSDAAENEPDRVEQIAAMERALTLAGQLAVPLLPDAQTRVADLLSCHDDPATYPGAVPALLALAITLLPFNGNGGSSSQRAP